MLAAHYRFSDLGERQSTSASFRPDPTVSYADSIGAVRDLPAELHRRDRCSDPAPSSSARQPPVADPTVRQTGAIAYALSGVVNQQIETTQQQVFADARNRPREAVDGLETLEGTDHAQGVG